MWVKSEYAGELAVVSAWLAALVPWSVHHSSFGEFGTTLFVRFPFLQVQFDWLTIEGGSQTGTELANGVWVADPVTAATLPAGIGVNVETASTVWAVAGSIVAVAVLLSLAMYAREDAVESALPVDPVRLMGALLGAASVVLSAATWLLYDGLPGVPIPVGVVLLFVLSGTLLTVDRTDHVPGREDADPDPEPEPDTDSA